jgi:four helix bundle protein
MDSVALKTRANSFAHRCVKLSLSLPRTILGNHVSSQLIRCSTSVAANYRAACISQSRAAFVSKLSIAIEESDEACFWMEFLLEEKLLKQQLVAPLLDEGKQLTSIFVASRKTVRKNQKSK